METPVQFTAPRDRAGRAQAIILAAALAIGAPLLGCVGAIGTHPGSPPPPASGTGGASGGGGMPGMTELLAARTPLRRLTRTEYNNTVRALLGDTTSPAAQFEPDVNSDGFTNNADTQNVDTSLAQQYLNAAEALSVAATKNLPALLLCDPATAEATCLRGFIARFGQRAWRRPLQGPEIDRLLGVYTTGRAQFDVATGVQMALQAMLLSPHFLYRVELGAGATAPGDATVSMAVPLTSWELASRLSYFLLGSMPDDALFAAAQMGALGSPAELAAQARRLLDTTAADALTQAQAQGRFAQFFTEWMHLTTIDKLTKDTTLFPTFSPDLAIALRGETEAFVKHTLFGGPGDLTTLLTAPYTYVTPDVAALYGANAPGATSDAPARLDLDPKQRAGILTQPALLATFAKADVPDPVHRGKFIWEGVLCQTVPPPPMGAKITPPVITPGTTARQRFQQHRADPSCASCHTFMDPIGLALENYDAVGRWRDKEGTLDIDASGALTGTDVDGPFVGGVELAHKLAGSKETAACVVRQLFRFAFGRYESPGDESTLRDLTARFEAGQRQVLDLAVAFAQTPAFRQLKVGP